MSDVNENPLVSFALFAYNQENFIREAIEGAFAQDYSPLEIILSDDYSTDRTFEIMQEMAASYKGPHSVTTRRNPINRGTLLHVIDVAEESKGDFLVLAAGDDVSKPWRCNVLARVFKETGAWAVYSFFDKIDEVGNIKSTDEIKLLSWERMRDYWSDGKNMTLILGATSAYDKRAFALLGKDLPRIMMEDSVMSAALKFANKKIELISESLVNYRVSSDSLTNHELKTELSISGISKEERFISNRAPWYRDQNYLFVQLYDDSMNHGISGQSGSFNKKLVLQDAALYDMREKWIHGSNFIHRCQFALHNIRNENIKWILPRLLGLKIFAIVKIILHLNPCNKK